MGEGHQLTPAVQGHQGQMINILAAPGQVCGQALFLAVEHQGIVMPGIRVLGDQIQGSDDRLIARQPVGRLHQLGLALLHLGPQGPLGTVEYL